ncbi:MAG: hypothetical protein K0S08_376 [Gammaproteobacteria bacterium]|jgi:hypothetical protein|nr:hypothetical protein [Gammaproteobacteria bacterium]
MYLVDLYFEQEGHTPDARLPSTQAAYALTTQGFKVTGIAYVSTEYENLVRITFENLEIAEKFKEKHSSAEWQWPPSPTYYLEYRYLEATEILYRYLSSEEDRSTFRSRFLTEIKSKKAAGVASPALTDTSTPPLGSVDNATQGQEQASPASPTRKSSVFFASIATPALQVPQEAAKSQLDENTPLTATSKIEQTEFKHCCVML